MASDYIPQRIKLFDAKESMTVVDYGCGSGRFTGFFSGKVGISGKVYAVDTEPKAIKSIIKLIDAKQLTNVVPVLANGYDSGLCASIADRV